MIVVIVIYSEFNLSPLVRSPGTWADGSTEGIWEFKSYILPVISKCYLRGVRDDDKSQSVSRHHRQLRDGAESYHRCTALRGRGTIITMTSEGDKYCARTDCGILERGSLKTKEEDEEEEVEGGREGKKKKNLATSFSTYPEEKCIIILFHTRLGSKAAKISLWGSHGSVNLLKELQAKA